MPTPTPTPTPGVYGPNEGIHLSALKDCVTRDEDGDLVVVGASGSAWGTKTPEAWADAFVRDAKYMVVRGNLLAYGKTHLWGVRLPAQAYGPERLNVTTLPINDAGETLSVDADTVKTHQARIKQYRADGWAVHFLYRSTETYDEYRPYGHIKKFAYTSQRSGKLGSVRRIRWGNGHKPTFVCYGYIAINPDGFPAESPDYERNDESMDTVIADIVDAQGNTRSTYHGTFVVNLTSGMLAYGYRTTSDYKAHVDALPDGFWAGPDPDADAAIINRNVAEAATQARLAHNRTKQDIERLQADIDRRERTIAELQAQQETDRAVLAQYQASLPGFEQDEAATQAVVDTPLASRYQLDARDVTAYLG